MLLQITITMAMVKWSGLVLFVLSVIALLGGNLPDHYGNPICTKMRLVVWPLFLLWLIGMLVRSLWL
mgnify:CR=1 FL=1